ncbi:MAG: hypothetical protein LUC33_04525 [Prevotellaceae bacterium]|nr:hypothetical protein [Prevotellaceae bacterium]
MSMICTVDSVDRDARTVDCTPIDGSAPLLGVNLQANQGSDFGIVAFPRKDSYVVVGFMSYGEAGAVLLTDDIESIEVTVSKDTARLTIDEDGIEVKVGDNVSLTIDKDTITAKNGDSISMEMTGSKITFNGGNNGGVPLSSEVADALNDIIGDINELKGTLGPITGTFMSGTEFNVSSWAATTLQTVVAKNLGNTDIEQ